MKRLLACAASIAALSSCISFDVEWERVEPGSNVVHEDGYRLELPVGWARAGNCVTRDGGQLQAILFTKGERGRTLPAMDTPELQKLLGPFEGDESVRLLESAEVMLGGRRAIQMRFEAGFGPAPGFLDFLAGSFLFPVDAWWRYELDWIEDPGGDTFVFIYGAPPLV